ncbi:MAG: protein of unknown function cysteine-rich region domain protein [Gemmatimonadetes bacterium]|nr:protein of unknown function cysteine-rich region domain protein [Gemmatimonadota bacterium]
MSDATTTRDLDSMCAIPGTPLADARAGIDACVHCGFCLQSCPTYLALEDENDSPRGRIVLMRGLVEGSLGLDDSDVRTHLDRCLGCRACETACPSGVPYGHLLEAARATLLERRPLALVARLILGVFANRVLLALAMSAGRMMRATRLPRVLGRLPGRAGFSMAMLASTEPAVGERDYPIAQGGRERVAILEGCVMQGLYAHVNRATDRTLRMNGYRVEPAAGQRCCGALHAHAGEADTARRLARENIAAFEQSGVDFIAVNAAGCGAMMKEYGQLLAGDPQWAERARVMSARVRDVSELLAVAGPAEGAPISQRVTYDAPCHLLHAQRVALPPMQLLRAIPGLDPVPLVDSDQCCGSAGIYNLVEPGTSDAVLAPKLRHISDTSADLVATGNPGCLMQIGAGMRQAGMKQRGVHPVELLDLSYALKSDAVVQ